MQKIGVEVLKFHKMKKAILYIHGKNGSAKEAEYYKEVCSGYQVFGLDYKGNTPWENKDEIKERYDELRQKYDEVVIIANSIGAFFAMNALQNRDVSLAFFISPILDTEKLITDMMKWAKVTESELKERGEVRTQFGETLSFEYLQYVRCHPISWMVPTYILYGAKDNLTALETVHHFRDTHQVKVTIMKDGEHWFHTKEQMMFLDEWIRQYLP